MRTSGETLGEMLYRQITDRSPNSEARTLGDALRYLRSLFGSRRATARAIGIGESTLRSWESGARPHDPQRVAGVLNLTRMVQRRARLPIGRERRMGRVNATDGLKLHAYVIVSEIETNRTIDIGRYLEDDTGRQLLNAFLDGTPVNSLGVLLVQCITDRWYRDQFQSGAIEVYAISGWR